MLVSLKGISKSYGGDLVLDNVSLEINESDRIGLVGINGCGKSTLLNIITSNTYNDLGEVIKKNNLTIGYLKQNVFLDNNNTLNDELKNVFNDVYTLKEKLEEFNIQMSQEINDSKKLDKIIKKYEKVNQLFESNDGYNIEYKINNVLNGLGFKDYNLNMKISDLSGGEKIRFALVIILLKEPELLVLDEPTNHLDFNMLDWLENYISTYKGAVITVSHDRYFLEKICKKICEIENKKLCVYKGNYSSFLVQKEEKIKKQEIEYEKQQEKIKKLNEFINKNIAKSASVNGVGTRVKELEKIEILQKPIYDKSIKLKFEYDKPSFKEVLQVRNLIVKINSSEKQNIIYDKISFNILRGEKVAIIGKNGIGKTTLLKAIQNKIEYEGSIKWGENVKISYFDQENKRINLENVVIDEIHNRFPDKTDLELRNLYAKLLITDDMVFKKIKELSGANRAKVVFAIMMLERANVLILDEPTNHLDYIAKEELSRALKEYDGTIIMVSHDRYLLNNVASKIIEVLPNKLNIYDGNYEYYLDNKVSKKIEKNQDISITREKNIILQNEKKKLSSIERKIKKIEDEIKTLDEKLNNVEISNDYIELSKISSKLDEKNSELDILMKQWLETNENIEKVNIK